MSTNQKNNYTYRLSYEGRCDISFIDITKKLISHHPEYDKLFLGLEGCTREKRGYVGENVKNLACSSSLPLIVIIFLCNK